MMMTVRVKKYPSGILRIFLIRKILIIWWMRLYENNYFREKVEEMKIVQKLRERPTGINVVGLALGENIASDVIMVRYIQYNLNIENSRKKYSMTSGLC